MNPIHRTILTVVRLLAAGLLLVGLLNMMIYWAKSFRDHAAMQIGHCVYLAIPAMLALILFVGSFPLARWFREHQDED